MKKYNLCKQEKPEVDFYKDKSQPGGFEARCKDCDRLYHRNRYRKNPELWKKKAVKFRITHPDYQRLSKKRYWLKHPDLVRSKNAIKHAIKSGRLVRVTERPCELCGKRAGVYHHPDYSRPLEVVPLCHVCHKQVHSASKSTISAGGYLGMGLVGVC